MVTTDILAHDTATALLGLQVPPPLTPTRRSRRRNHCERGGSAMAPTPRSAPSSCGSLLPSTLLAGLDPLADDRDDDMPVVTTARGLVRLATVAAQTGQRFRDEGIDLDPVAWLLSPRALFGGRTALEACQRREPFVLATMVHGLSLGLDCDPVELQALLGSAPPIDGDVRTEPHGLRPNPGDAVLDGKTPSAKVGTSVRLLDAPVRRLPRPSEGDDLPGRGSRRLGETRLYTATMTKVSEEQVCHLFHASLATSRDEFVETLECRLGAARTRRLKVGRGIDWHCPAVEAIVASEMSHLLDNLEDGDGARGDEHLDLWVERRLPPVPPTA